MLRGPMISVAAIRMQQVGVSSTGISFGQRHRQARPVAVLDYGEKGQTVLAAAKKTTAPSKVNWDLLERDRLERKGYQREIIRKKSTIVQLLERAARRGTCRRRRRLYLL